MPRAPALIPPQQAAATTIEGVLERVIYANDDNAWSVVKLVVAGKSDLLTAVGNLLGVQPGESLRLSGRWATDKKYGEQFRVESYVTVKPATLVGIERYLGSGLVRGVGKVMAERLVGHFGMTTLEVIDQEPSRLTEVEGIGPVRSDRITKAWVEQRQIKDVMVFLQSHGVSTAYASRIYKQYRDRSIAVVRGTPAASPSTSWALASRAPTRSLRSSASAPRHPCGPRPGFFMCSRRSRSRAMCMSLARGSCRRQRRS
jgi:exodeoxyribonuclease V alpha subunit